MKTNHSNIQIVKASIEEPCRPTTFYETLIDEIRNHRYKPKWVKGYCYYPTFEEIEFNYYECLL